ncbi:MAG: TRAP transporter large permease subunit, partial [Casimicrobiaceae bacterium]
KLGIDLIWFGVLLAVNMQTSFMHPPFGFALFYLRSVAARKEYTDRVTGKRIAPVTTGQIYRGAIPFVLVQIVMIALVIAFPQMVMVYKAADTGVDPTKIQIRLPPGDTSAPLPIPGQTQEQMNRTFDTEENKDAQSIQDLFGAPAPAPGAPPPPK